jgi:hypothetical protein
VEEHAAAGSGGISGYFYGVMGNTIPNSANGELTQQQQKEAAYQKMQHADAAARKLLHESAGLVDDTIVLRETLASAISELELVTISLIHKYSIVLRKTLASAISELELITISLHKYSIVLRETLASTISELMKLIIVKRRRDPYKNTVLKIQNPQESCRTWTRLW